MHMKHLIILLCCMSTLHVYAQFIITEPKNYLEKKQPFVVYPEKSPAIVEANLTSNQKKKPAKASSMIEISSSANVYAVLYAYARQLTYNQELNSLVFIHRGNPSGAIGISKNDIVATVSTNNGTAWADFVLTTDTSKHNRHPSVAIFNPAGNKDVAKAFNVFCGPITDDIDWVSNYFGTARLDTAYKNTQYISTPAQIATQGLTVCSDSTAHVLGFRMDTTPQGKVTQLSAIVNTGKFNTTSKDFVWSQTTITPSFFKDAKGNLMASLNMNHAWSTDGQTGYVFFVGIDSANPYKTFTPIVYKTKDKGVTWKKMPPFNFGGLHSMAKYLTGTIKDTSIKKPFFTDETINGAVDYKGNLHIFSQVCNGSSANIDSIGYVNGALWLFDVFTTSDTSWNSGIISALLTQAVTEQDKLFGSAGEYIGWDHRLQLSKTRDGKKLFFVWADSDPEVVNFSWDNSGPINELPNLVGFAKDVEASLVTDVYLLTGNGSDAEYVSYWHNVSEFVTEFIDGYLVPVSITPILNQYALEPDKPVTHYYLPTIGFYETDFIYESVAETTQLQTAQVQVYPNPCKTSAVFTFVLDAPSTMNFSLHNVMGQQVYTETIKKCVAGINSYTFNRQDLPAGLYVYTFSDGNTNKSGKLIIK